MPKRKKIFTEAEKNAIKWLVCHDGKTIKEVAQIFKMPESTFQSMVKYNNFVDELKETRQMRSAKFKESLYRLSFPRETKEKKYEMVLFTDPKTGKQKKVPQLKEIKVKTIEPNSTALQTYAINFEKLKTTSGDLEIDATAKIKGFDLREAEESFEKLKKNEPGKESPQ